MLKSLHRSSFFLLFCFAFVAFSLSAGCSDGSNEPCTNGLEATCLCPDGKIGLQTCAEGQWGACGQCGSSQAKPTCKKTGLEQTCQCNGGLRGEQKFCEDNQKWLPCQCQGKTPIRCKLGEKKSCTCSDQTSSQQTCDANATWGVCECAPVGADCKEGATQQCLCNQNQGTGTQSCTGGKWGACTGCKASGAECQTVGSTKRCQCPNGASSRQTCGAGGKWGACNCGGTTCTAGATTSCTCATGMPSTRTCVKGADGKTAWGDCQCSCSKGQTRPCDCGNQQKGVHECKCDASPCTWSACKCPTCKADSDCASQTSAKVCDKTLGRCVECLSNTQCKAPNQTFCSPSTAECVACLKDDDCQGGDSCDPFTQTCKKIGKGALSGALTRCIEGKPRPAGCSGNTKRGDDQGPIYFLFFSGKNFPPRYSEKPFFVHKIAKTDFSDSSKKISYKIENIPAGNWLVFVFLDDNNNWSPGQHMPDLGDLVAVTQGVEVKANATSNADFYLFDRY